MSAVEKGLGGVWSCLYCEGTWLPHEQRAKFVSLSHESLAALGSPPQQELVCPACESPMFLATTTSGAHTCSVCGSLFLTRGVLGELAPQAISPSKEAPVVQALAGVIGGALVGDPTALVSVLFNNPPSPE